ncbi:MAG TPA: rhodanese-like domain-containing protein [candidate division Zixibacteria bacterium]|nr:rhodanese-like domain-containing protein [candidate division Zixibacteria bacterium]
MENLQFQNRRPALIAVFCSLSLLAAAVLISGCKQKESKTSGQDTDMTASITVQQLKQAIDQDKQMFLLDVRTEPEFEEDRLSFADLRISFDSLAMHLDELPSDKGRLIYVFCRSGRRSGIATDFLRSMGYSNVHDVSGGIKAWKVSGYPTVSGELP